jgi:hypothetical protein
MTAVDPETRDRVLVALGAVERAFNPSQKRDPHGRWSKVGGAATAVADAVRDILRDASTTEDVSAVLAREASRIAGRDITADMRGSDVQVAREHAEGVLRGLERFPKAPLRAVQTHGPGGAVPASDDGFRLDAHATTKGGRYSVPDDVISFSTQSAGRPSAYGAQLKAAKIVGYSLSDTPMAVALHEFGHVFAHYGDGEMPAFVKLKELGYRRVKESVSRYAAGDHVEFAAEAFADVMVNGDAADEVSRDLFDEMVRGYERRASR